MTIDWMTVAVIGWAIGVAGILFGFYEWRRSYKLARVGRLPSVISSVEFSGIAIAMANTNTGDSHTPDPPKEVFDVHHSVKIENIGETPAINIDVSCQIGRGDGPRFERRLLKGKEKVLLFPMTALSSLEQKAQGMLADGRDPSLTLVIRYQDTENRNHTRTDRFKYLRENHQWLALSCVLV